MQVKVTVGETAAKDNLKQRNTPTDSSVGRAEDCRVEAESLRSLVQVRVRGANFIFQLCFFKFVEFSWTPKIICFGIEIFSLRC